MSATAGPSAHADRLTATQVVDLLRSAIAAWVEDAGPSMGAALAYYTLFSIAPLALIVIAVAGLFFGVDATRGELVAQLSGLIGADGAAAVETLLRHASRPSAGLGASAIGLVTLLLGATSVVTELQADLNRIWRVPPDTHTSTMWLLIRSRLLSIGLILALGFLLLVSLVISAALAALQAWWGSIAGGWEPALQAANVAVGFAISTALFALIYKILPQARVAWSDVWMGAVMTSLLFSVGKLAIGLYVGWTGVSSPFGAAGSVVVLMVWVYYSAQIFLLGAELTWLYAHRHGSQRHLGDDPMIR
jgi:membrane protein